MKKCHWEGNEFIGCCEEVKTDNHGNVLILIYNLFGAEYNSFDFCPFCGASLEKPVKIEPGMFGKFYDDEDEIPVYGILDKIDQGDRPYIYVFSISEGGYKHFTPGLPEGFNQDGTPKKEGNNE